MKTRRPTPPIPLGRPIDIPAKPQHPPRHIPFAAVGVIQQILLGEPRVEAPRELEERGVIREELRAGGEDEEAAVEVGEVGVGRVGVVVAPGVGVGGEHVGAWERGFVGAELGFLREGWLGEGCFVVEDAVQRFGDQGVGVDEADFRVLCQLEEAEFG